MSQQEMRDEIAALILTMTGKQVLDGETWEEYLPKFLEALHLGKAALDALIQPATAEPTEYAETESGVFVPRKYHPLYDN